ncbi:MAG: sulfatase [bacterium]
MQFFHIRKILKTAGIAVISVFIYFTSRAHAAPHSHQLPAGYNLILIGWDTLRADHVSALGYKRKTTPNLDRLAGRSFLFTKAISPASWTLPAFMSIFTSLYPSQHGVTNKYKLPSDDTVEFEMTSLSTDAVTLAQVFKANGYKTAAFTGGAGLGGHFGFSRGFDVYVDSGNFVGFDSTFPQAIDWLSENSNNRFFLFIHGYDTHPFHNLKADGRYSFIPPEEASDVLKIRERHEKMRMDILEGKKVQHTNADIRLWNDAYDEKIVRADRLWGKFLTDFSALKNTAENTVIILLSDHGEELFDHGGVDHGMTLYDEVIHVPLLIHVPHKKGRIIDAQVRTMDIFPTIMELLALKQEEKLPEQLQGSSLVARMNGDTKPLDAFSETDYLFHFNKRAVRKSNGLKLTYDGFTQDRRLYDTLSDPGEKTDIFEKEAAKSYPLEIELFNWLDDINPR